MTRTWAIYIKIATDRRHTLCVRHLSQVSRSWSCLIRNIKDDQPRWPTRVGEIKSDQVNQSESFFGFLIEKKERNSNAKQWHSAFGYIAAFLKIWITLLTVSDSYQVLVLRTMSSMLVTPKCTPYSLFFWNVVSKKLWCTMCIPPSLSSVLRQHFFLHCIYSSSIVFSCNFIGTWRCSLAPQNPSVRSPFGMSYISLEL